MEEEIYRIPKRITADFRILGLTARGFIYVGLAVVLWIVQFMVLPPHHVNSALPRIFIPAFFIAVLYLYLSNPTLSNMLELSRYHSRHAKILRWESSHHEIVKPFQEAE